MLRNFANPLSTALFAIVCLVLGISSAAPAATATRVKTGNGIVEGEATADQKVIAFKGIPFAAPPVGDLRWRPPVAAVPWTGVRMARDFGYHCAQFGSYNDMLFHDSGGSEDCLTLNVWTPAGSKPGSLPVMVWIYGGGFSTGGTSEHRQDGQFLAHRNVVVVSMNYRLSIFGFLVHPELTAESPHQASGNYGLMDMAAALEWVRRNIASFGGDPKNITIFGESAGSFAVSILMASPLSKDLFSKAIGESGGALHGSGPGYRPLKEREQRDSAFLQTAFGTTRIADLRRISTEDIVRTLTAPTAPPAPRFGPDIDGYFLPDSVARIYAAGRQARVPLLAGWNADEGRGEVVSANPKPGVATFTAQAEKDFDGRASEFLAVYPAPNGEDAFNSASDFAGDKFIAYATWSWLEGHVQTGKSPVYRYLFSLGSPGDKNHPASLGAFHSDDIEYVFGTLDSRPGAAWRPEDRKLSEQMMQYWTNFARTGDPGGDHNPDGQHNNDAQSLHMQNLPEWPLYGPAEWQTMNLSADSQARSDMHRPRYLFLDSVWGRDKAARSPD